MLHITKNAMDRGSRTIFPVGAQNIASVWPLIAEYLKDRKDGIMAQWDLQNLLSFLLNDPEHYLWVAWDNDEIEGLMLVGFSHTPKVSQLWIQAINCDNLRKYAGLLRDVEDWAQMMGASSVLFEGDKRFERLIRKYGYAMPTAIYKKSLRQWSN